jgi:hypothetical protein
LPFHGGTARGRRRRRRRRRRRQRHDEEEASFLLFNFMPGFVCVLNEKRKECEYFFVP